MALVYLENRDADAERSPELRYLASCNRAAARYVFGELEELVWRSGQPVPELPRDRPLLVLGGEQVHLGPASLERLQHTLADGATVALPNRLASFELAAATPIHTLRGYEAIERRILEDGLAPRQPRRSHLPVALFAPQLLTEHRAELSVERLLGDADLLAALGVEPALAGVFHGYVDYYGEVRADVLPFLPEGVLEVLEVGCGRGLTGALLEARRGCRVTGVELHPGVAREAAGRLHRVIVGDIEGLDLAAEGLEGRFDAVVATELFEHLSYPERFLEAVRGALKPGGRIVLSVPNVGHYSIVEDLLAGRWDYLPIGLLCYTHFRFFTRATLASWLERTGFATYEIVAQTSELPEHILALGERVELDAESLRTKGFYVVIEV